MQKLDLVQRREEHYAKVKQINENLRNKMNQLSLVNQELVEYVGYLENLSKTINPALESDPNKSMESGENRPSAQPGDSEKATT